MKLIAVEEHFITRDFALYLHSREAEPKLANIDTPGIKNRIDMDERLRLMDSSGIDMQLLSLGIPGVEPLEPENGVTWARKINDELAGIVRQHPDRFAGTAALPMQDPAAAVVELERAVGELGMKGVHISSHVQGEYLDEKKFWVVFAKAEELGVPVYIHPRHPSPDMIKPYEAYPGLQLAMLGFAAEVSLHSMRLICSGLFDEYPGLKIVIGHMGEALPYWLWRIDNHFERTTMAETLKKKPSEYFKDNFYITTSGMFTQPPLLCAYLTLGADQIMFAVDYPHEENEPAVKFIEEAPISDGDKEKICHLNAERLYKL